jgi:hypothetical protein
MPRLLLALLRYIVHHSQVLVDPSSITIMIHMSLRVFDKLMLVTLCYVDVDEYIFIVTPCVTTSLITFIKVLIKTQIH